MEEKGKQVIMQKKREICNNEEKGIKNNAKNGKYTIMQDEKAK